MTPLIVVSQDSQKIADFIRQYRSEHNISPSYIYEISPKEKEISIEQIREIKKGVVYNNNESQLFVLYEFDSASYEAQNAFLKTLEEHRENIHFLLIVKSYRNLTPTVVSRSKINSLDGLIKAEEDTVFDKKMDDFLTNPSLKILADASFQAKQYEDPLDLFDKLIEYFRERASSDKNASFALRELVRLRTLVQKNNVDPQNAADFIFITLSQTYRQA